MPPRDPNFRGGLWSRMRLNDFFWEPVRRTGEEYWEILRRDLSGKKSQKTLPELEGGGRSCGLGKFS